MPNSEMIAYTDWPSALRSCVADPRFSYCTYMPTERRSPRPRNLVVVVHGSERDAMGYRDDFVDFAGRDAGDHSFADLHVSSYFKTKQKN